MRDWVIAKLEAIDEEQFDRKIKAAVDPDPNVQAYMRTLVKRQLAELRTEERAIAEADCGNMKPLQRLYPQLERFLQPPKLKRGQHFKPLGGQWDLQAQIRHARADIPASGRSGKPNTASLIDQKVRSQRPELRRSAGESRLKPSRGNLRAGLAVIEDRAREAIVGDHVEQLRDEGLDWQSRRLASGRRRTTRE